MTTSSTGTKPAQGSSTGLADADFAIDSRQTTTLGEAWQAYVNRLRGGEMGALLLLDACIRLLPGVMGAPTSGHEESFEDGLLEYPQYTRPQEWEGRTIPEVLRSGDHAKIAAWRKARSEDDTRLRRPDLWERHIGARVQSASGARHEDQD